MKSLEKWTSTLLILGGILGSYVALKVDLATMKTEQAALEQRLQDTRDEVKQLENRLFQLANEWDGADASVPHNHR